MPEEDYRQQYTEILLHVCSLLLKNYLPRDPSLIPGKGWSDQMQEAVEAMRTQIFRFSLLDEDETEKL